VYFNASNGAEIRGDWNRGQGPWQRGEEWVYVSDPIKHVRDTQGLTEQPIQGSSMNVDDADRLNRQMSQQRSDEIKAAVPRGAARWSEYTRTLRQG